jgi:hypothetical protein
VYKEGKNMGGLYKGRGGVQGKNMFGEWKEGKEEVKHTQSNANKHKKPPAQLRNKNTRKKF